MIRRVIIRIVLVVATMMRRSADFFRRGASFFAGIVWGIARRKDMVHLIQISWDRDRVLKEEKFVLGGLFPWEEKLYDAHLPQGGRVGLIGCGAGRDLIGLAREGYNVEGIDLSPVSIHLAEQYLKKTALHATLHCADICTFDFTEQAYDALIFSNFTYCLIPGSSERIGLLRRLRMGLAPQGCLLVTYFNERERRPRPSFKLARTIARWSRNPELPEPGDQFTAYSGFEHLFTHDEFARETKEAGYAIKEIRPLVGETEFVAVLTSTSSSVSDE